MVSDGYRLISFDIVSLYTNVNIVVAIRASREVVQEIDPDKLPLNNRDYLELVEKCMKFGSFTFNNSEYNHCEGLSMGSPLSVVSASLFMEMLEKEHISDAIQKDSKWFRYVNDYLCITQNTADTHYL
ncbi:telomerase reverse transcriptase-like [Oratosquilla oratoria]|uniref:telomerase reverse transcriptase-like n=1 Tax=Oratosquilla oratoria TaxID=337810 RepID=UPI003F75A5E0